jgi:putative tricarboxylic transport membrane protein
MKTKALICSSIVIPVLCAVAAAPCASAATFPDDKKVVEFVVHMPTGSGAGLFMLTAGELLNRNGIIKAKIQVMSKPGGSSAVALNYVESKKGDPYYAMMWTTSNLMAMNRGTTTMKFNEATWLSTMIQDGNVLMVPYNSPYQSVADIIKDAKANPKKISVGINSVGGSEHIMATRIERVAGVRLNATAFEFSPTQLIGGHIHMAFGNTSESAGHVQAKRVRVLANMGDVRLPYYKDIPTLKEQGIDASFTQYRGFVAGPNMPAEAVKVWDEAFAKLSKTKEWADFMAKNDYMDAYRNSAETKAFLQGYNQELLKDLKQMEGGK